MRLTYNEETGKVTEGSVVDPKSSEYDKPVAETKKDKFFRIMDSFGDMVFLNLVFFATSIPLITLGASFTALYTVTLKMVRKEEGKVVPSYFKAFKKNFFPATKAWLVVLVYLYLMYIEYQFLAQMGDAGLKAMIIIMGLEMLLLAFVLPLLFPLIARYENTTFNYFKNSLFIAFSQISVWFRVFISWMAPVLLTLVKIEILIYAWYVWALILCSVLAYSDSIIIRNMFDELEAAENERAGEAAKGNGIKEEKTDKKTKDVKSTKGKITEIARGKGAADK